MEGERSDDGLACCVPPEAVEAEVRVEHARHAPLEPLQVCECVLPDRDHEGDGKVGPGHGACELAREPVPAVLVRVVDEVLLELIENDDQVVSGSLGARCDRGGEVLVDEIAVEAARPAQRRRQRRGRVTAPVGEDDGDQVADRPQPGHRARVQEGALSDAALPEEEGQS